MKKRNVKRIRKGFKSTSIQESGQLSQEESEFMNGTGLESSDEVVIGQGRKVVGGTPKLNNKISNEMFAKIKDSDIQTTIKQALQNKVAVAPDVTEDPLSDVEAPLPPGEIVPLPKVDVNTERLNRQIPLTITMVTTSIAETMPDMSVGRLNDILEGLGFELPFVEYEEEDDGEE